MQVGRINCLNIVCMYAALYRNEEDKSIEGIAVPDDYVKFGDYAVLIANAAEFVKRVEYAVQRERYCMWRRAIRYVDRSAFDVEMISEEIDVAFLKSQTYESEQEYRFAIDTEIDGTNAIKLDIGSIRDIAVRVSTAEINSVVKRLLSSNSAAP